jgi:hypothetical protein
MFWTCIREAFFPKLFRNTGYVTWFLWSLLAKAEIIT